MNGENHMAAIAAATEENPRLQWAFQGSTLMGVKVPLTDLVAELERQKATKVDYVVDTSSLKMVILADGLAHLAFPVGDEHPYFSVKNRCHYQIADKLKIPQRYYDRMRDERPELLATNVNAWMPEREKRLVRTLDGKARALLSAQFRTLDNIDMFFYAAQEFEAAGAMVVRADMSEERFYMRAILPDVHGEVEPGDPYFGGLSVSNSEVGSGMLKVELFTWRQTCSNGALGEKVFQRVHLGEELEAGIYQDDTISKSSEAVWLKLRDHIRAAFRDAPASLNEWLDKVRGTKTVQLPDPTKLVTGSWKGLDVTPDEKANILRHLMGDGEGLTQYGFGQAVTATAKNAADADRRAALERLGYRVLSEGQGTFDARMVQACVPAARQVA